MRNHAPASLSGLALLVVLLSVGLRAQWLNFPTPGTPRTRDGKPNLAAPVPRAPDGNPDLSGVWLHEFTTLDELRRLYGAGPVEEALKGSLPGQELWRQNKYAMSLLIDFKPGQEPLRPNARAVMSQRRLQARPGDDCNTVLGFPHAGLGPSPIKIVQSKRLTIVLYEQGNMHRQIYTDGRALPKEFDKPAYLGYSVGRWDRDSFVVESAGFNDRARLDLMGHPHSEALHVTERFHRRDFGHMDMEVTFDDPEMYTMPFTIKVTHNLMADEDIFEDICNENEKDRLHMK